MISRLIQRMKKNFAMQKLLWRGKRKEVKGIGGNALKKLKSSSNSQLFRGKIPYNQPSSCCSYVFLVLEGKITCVCLSVAS